MHFMGKSFTLVQLRYFGAVAKLENMTAAAAELNVTQSTLSSAMAQLERELGAALFTRLSSKGLRLTPAGRRLLLGSQAFLEEADLLYQAVRDESEALAGELVVGIYSPLAPFKAPVILQAFEAAHPNVKVSFHEGDQESLRQALLDGVCEVALMYDLGVGREFERRMLERIPPHVLVSAEHPRAARREEPVSLREFAQEPFILLDLKHTREYYLDMFKQLGIRPETRHVVSGYETVRSYVARGHGYSLLNQRISMKTTYAGGEVVALGIIEELPPIEVSLVRPVGAKPTRKSRAFERICIELYGKASG
ncbi:LysR family transcriptional regulator [Paeniglutamicibacter cryotolerans]